MWNLDGVVITDTTSGGASSSYFDFDAFDEINGRHRRQRPEGADRRRRHQLRDQARHQQLPRVGAQLLQPQRRCSRRTCPTSSRATRASLRRQRQGRTTSTRSTTGASTSAGPIIKDKLWFWGSYGKQRHPHRPPQPDQGQDAAARTTNAKLNWQASAKDQVSFFFFNGAKEKFGRSPGAGRQRARLVPAGTRATSIRTGLRRALRLHGLWKVEDNHVFSPNFFVNAKYACFGWGYGFAPRGGADQDGGVDYDTDQAYGSWSHLHGAQALAHRRRQRQLTSSGDGRQPRVQVRVRLPQQPEHLDHHAGAASQVVGLQQSRRTRSTRRRIAQRVVKLHRRELERLPRRHVHQGPPHGRTSACAGTGRRRRTSASTAPANTAFPELLPALVVRRRRSDHRRGTTSRRAWASTYALDDEPEDGGAGVVRALRRPAQSRSR